MRGFRTSARHWAWIAASVGVMLVAGCQSSAPRKRIVAVEPGLTDSGATVVESAPPGGTQVTWVDRHPLFTKPREYYDKSTSSNSVVKAAAATVLGIPAGIIGEVRQIVTGSPTGVKD